MRGLGGALILRRELGGAEDMGKGAELAGTRWGEEVVCILPLLRDRKQLMIFQKRKQAIAMGLVSADYPNVRLQ